jgi:hypothetical protein
MNDDDWSAFRPRSNAWRRVWKRVRNDFVAVQKALRPAALVDAIALSVDEHRDIVFKHPGDDAVVVIRSNEADATVFAHRDAFRRCFSDDSLFQSMRIVDVDSFESRSIVDALTLLATIRQHLVDALADARHADVIVLPDWNVYPPTLVGLLLMYPVIYGRSSAATPSDWQRETALNSHRLRLVRVHVESPQLLHAPSPGELQVSRLDSVGPTPRGQQLWSFSMPASLDGAFETHFRTLIDRDAVADDCIHVTLVDLSTDDDDNNEPFAVLTL